MRFLLDAIGANYLAKCFVRFSFAVAVDFEFA